MAKFILCVPSLQQIQIADDDERLPSELFRSKLVKYMLRDIDFDSRNVDPILTGLHARSQLLERSLLAFHRHRQRQRSRPLQQATILPACLLSHLQPGGRLHRCREARLHQVNSWRRR